MRTTNVFLVVDQSASMKGPKEAMQKQLVWDVVKHMGDEVREGRGDYRMGFFGVGGRVVTHSPRVAHTITKADVDHICSSRNENTALHAGILEALKAAELSTAEADLVSIFSDGEENASGYAATMAIPALLQTLNARGKLTVTFAGPATAARYLAGAGIPAGNFKAWDGSEAAMPEVQRETVTALQTYTTSRSNGITRSATLYADASKLTTGGVRGYTKQVTPVETKTVSKHMDGRAIADFFKPFKPGAHYYQLVKAEYIQEDKDLVIHIKDANEYRQGSRTARILLGLPETGKIRVAPGPHSDKFDIYVQSASVNRKLVEGQKLLTL